MKSKLQKPGLTIQHLLKEHLDELYAQGLVNSYEHRILKALQACRTAALGGHTEACDSCGELKVHYNSCGNRHCPACQGANRERWLLEREYDLFDVPHHHITFTVPAELRALFKLNERLLYNMLFQSMWSTLLSFSKDKRSRLQAEIGVISILHTWTQKLEYHPHLHCIVPAGGLTAAGKWKSKDGGFLFSVKALSTVFKNRFCEQLKKNQKELHLPFGITATNFYSFLRRLKAKKWVVNSKPGFKGKESVLEYLGRYTHKIAISNYRLIKEADGKVVFSYRDRKAGDVKKVMQLEVKEFLCRFKQHILPRSFVKIRHYGLFSTRVKQEKLARVRKALGQPQKEKKEKKNLSEVMLETTGENIYRCKSCREGDMVVLKLLPPVRGSPGKLSAVKLKSSSMD
ncbi:IS91 family transposase [Nafulsella turpanensis]|uniref:IS91 family transposase n=1 Tax=Nafulsella turpanensis TaxID=1265690 RepID=UPI00135F1703|nr:IS91 family transposase [Nafulsella turpanensis]